MKTQHIRAYGIPKAIQIRKFVAINSDIKKSQ
jgi:hypothetical protein